MNIEAASGANCRLAQGWLRTDHLERVPRGGANRDHAERGSSGHTGRSSVCGGRDRSRAVAGKPSPPVTNGRTPNEAVATSGFCHSTDATAPPRRTLHPICASVFVFMRWRAFHTISNEPFCFPPGQRAAARACDQFPCSRFRSLSNKSFARDKRVAGSGAAA